MEMISQQTIDSFRKAKLKLLLSYPFFASMLFKLEHIWDDSIPTACTNGVELRINPEYWDSLDKDVRPTLLAHEACHPMLLHHTRRNNRDPNKWNESADYAINPILKNSGLKLGEGWLYDSQYEGMSSEQIYELIKDQPSSPNSGPGEVADFPGEDKQQEEYKQADSMIQANELAKLAGKGSPMIDQLIKELITPKIDWKDELRRIMTEKMKDDYTWTKPNKRYLGTGFYLPSLENETFGMIALFWDTSGSTKGFQEDFSGEINSIKTEVNAPLQLVYFDSKVTGAEFFLPDEDIVINPKGGGGTDFKPPVEWVEQNDLEPKLGIFFTDGYCYSYPPEPDYEILWAVCGNENFKPPYGTVIVIK